MAPFVRTYATQEVQGFQSCHIEPNVFGRDTHLLAELLLGDIRVCSNQLDDFLLAIG